MVFVTHDAGTVERMCARALYLRDGLPVLTGTAHDVVTTYHRHLAEQGSKSAASGREPTQSDTFSVAVKLFSADQSEQHVFTEGESVVVTVIVQAQQNVEPVRLALTIRDDLDRALGTTWRDNVDVKAGTSSTFTVTLNPDVLRSGRFPIDFAIRDATSSHTYFEASAIETFTILSQRAASGGPIQLGAVWSEPA